MVMEMLVKCQTFTKDSFHSTAVARARYIEKEGRAIGGVSIQNITSKNWAKEMDQTRETYHLRGNVIGREFILSPEPKDKVTPEEMREYAHEFLQKFFPNAEAAVAIHADSKERLLHGEEGLVHAHCYINTPDLVTGKKIILNNKQVRDIHDKAQDMARERGWSTMQEYQIDRETGQARRIESKRGYADRRPLWQKQMTRNPEYEASEAKKAGVSQYEYEHQLKNIKQPNTRSELEKTTIRKELKASVQEMKQGPDIKLAEALKKRGIEISHAANGDFKYRMANGNCWFKGKTLGDKFERQALQREISLAREHLMNHKIEIDFN